ncbi:DUF1996 domain-containing protein [Amycolatopsis roodepoortensis]|uniref:DUF1996 domain-containing protein n=1 Tax=Amycolatopsis roodepoortensis TaxID=700274 RepID=UPI00214AAE0F|nr:DUF1996 domain-containing protein [Amycolatopsis roodepoortensis]
MARHRLSKKQVRLTAAAMGSVIAVATTVLIATSGGVGAALADGQGNADDYVDITTVQPNVQKPDQKRAATKGSFTVDCGRNENGHFNPDNFIAQPGVRNGAQHLHDYVGNLSTNADSTNESLLASGTTCRNGDKSAYFWPVIRINENGDAEAPNKPPKNAGDRDQRSRNDEVVNCPDVAPELPDVPEQAQQQVDKALGSLDDQVEQANRQLAASGQRAVPDSVLTSLQDRRATTLRQMADAIGREAQRAGLDRLAGCKASKANDKVFSGQKATLQGADQNNELPGNEGEIQRPEVVKLTFEGSPVGKVQAMPKFLRILYGDAKVSTNGTRNARASWTCTGFEDRLIDKYPICPGGSKVERIHEFPSCWDGKNIDSANHRDHIVYPNAAGKCAQGFRTVPKLTVTLVYNIPQQAQRERRYAVDAFPEEEHNPLSDHDDFANVMPQKIMNRVVNCINKNKTCRE